ncbi:hypothetical protein Cch01nite_32290 [Cellulomonas chitinilytica]|uniref:Putative T7SS secretion signal domain-containing protein n=1 Tax=Cellulomonas chitinilytica TaxID=398759 RepID=A0A919U064_9CELL|nr:hypothetical protein [Cellulomonas chitinilytica]GIG22505.1 hypothetical protein Cch01nite_32290 [Cellulomonas chitinilytica]
MTEPLWHLGNTTDVTLLVAGRPSSLRTDASLLENVATALESVSDHAAARSATPSWHGWARDEWAKRRDVLLTSPAAIAEIYRAVARAVRAHADTVEWAQAGASTSVDLWAHGVALSRTAGVAWVGATVSTGALTDPGSPTREAASRILERCRREATISGACLARVMDEFTSGMPDGRFHGTSFFAGVWDWLTSSAALVWKLNGVRSLVDPLGWLSGARSEWDDAAGVFRIVTSDPLRAGPALADVDGLRDDPARWWGELAPDLALAAVAGVGAGSRVLGFARAGERLALVEGVATARPRTWPAALEPGTWEYSLGFDPDVGKLRMLEYRTATRIIDERGVHLERAPQGSRADWLDSEGRSYDAVGGFDGAYLHGRRDWTNLLGQIDRHLEKAELVPVDVSGFTPEQVARVRAYIEPLGERVFIVGEQ